MINQIGVVLLLPDLAEFALDDAHFLGSALIVRRDYYVVRSHLIGSSMQLKSTQNV